MTGEDDDNEDEDDINTFAKCKLKSALVLLVC